MRKRGNWLAGGLLFCLPISLFPCGFLAQAADAPAATYSALSHLLLERAQKEVARMKELVDQGTLPKSKLEQAQAALADAEDEIILSSTLYDNGKVQDMLPAQANSMLAAAQRRVDRQSKNVEDRRKLLEQGIIARSEFASYEEELNSRQQTLQLAMSRIRLLEELKQMASVEQALERRSQAQSASSKDVMIHYGGNGLFNLNDLTTISAQFEKQFHRPLPISALGQTLVHQSLGLDHRNRVDVALNPDQAEGLWLRHLLETLHVPYLAFRSAVAGAATAPHIHIGIESTRLRVAQR